MHPILDIEKFLQPTDLGRAADLLSISGNGAKIIAGGTDLLPRRQGGRTGISQSCLVDISRLGLNYIRETTDECLIGATTAVNAIGDNSFFHLSPYNALSEAARAHSTPTLRNRATIGGNLCNASPHADLALPLLALNARVVIEGIGGQRTLDLENFFTGPHCTVLEPEELLVEIRIPLIREPSGSNFIKLTRQHTAIDMAIVNTATCISITDGICTWARIALGSVGPFPFRAKKAEALLVHHPLETGLLQAAALLAAEEASPIDDIRATAAYRKEMIPLLVRQSLEKSLETIRMKTQERNPR